MKKFLETPTLIQEETENLNRPETSKETEVVILKLPTSKAWAQMASGMTSRAP